MADTREGLGGGDGHENVNTDAGFLAALAEQAGTTVPEETLDRVQESDRTVNGGLTEESAQTPNRDDIGRFAKSETAAEPGKEAEGAAPAEAKPAGQEEQTDPELQALLERHGGDASAALADALRQNKEAQSLVGRHANEVGELRAAQAKLEGRLEELSRQKATPEPAPVPITAADIQNLEQKTLDHGGQQMMNWVVNNRPDMIEQAIDVWAQDDPVAAGRFAVRYEMNLAASQQTRTAETTTAQPNETLALMARERELGASLAEVKTAMSQTPEGVARWDTVKDHLVPALADDSTPSIIKNAVVSEDAATRLQGISALVSLAEGRAIREATARATEEQAATTAAAKANARVATSGSRPVEARQPAEEETPEDRAARLERFHQALMKTETTSVRDGLVYANK